MLVQGMTRNAMVGLVLLLAGLPTIASARRTAPKRKFISPAIGQLFKAIRHVETGSHADPANARGDGGRSLGPYQITWAYWKDSRVPGHYRNVRNRAYAERVMIAYWQRYCPEALKRNDWQTLAKVHNAGPNGTGVSKAAGYWSKVRRALSW